MKKAILPLLLIITMVLSASVASASDFTGSGAVGDANGWTTTGNWQQNTIEYGLIADGYATATHPVVTGASGDFTFLSTFQVADPDNRVEIGLVAKSGAAYSLVYDDNAFYLLHDGDYQQLGTLGSDPTATQYVEISSKDGSSWHFMLGGYADLVVNDVPESITIVMNNAGESSSVLYTVSFTSAGEPAINALPAITVNADIQKTQDYYNNVYPILFGQQGNVGMTPAPAATGATVSGTVTAAADGKAIAGASVVLDLAKQTTDSNGNYKFTGVSNGAAELAVSANGYAAQTLNINVNGDMTKNIALVKAAAGSSATASAANETANTTVTNTTVTNTTTATHNTTATTNTTVPSPTQTKSPGFEGIIAAIAMIGAAGVLVYVNRKH